MKNDNLLKNNINNNNNYYYNKIKGAVFLI